MRQAVEKLKDQANTSNQGTNAIVTAAVAGLSDSAVVQLPPVPSLSRTVLRARVRENLQLTNAVDLESLVIPERFGMTKNDELFFIARQRLEKKVFDLLNGDKSSVPGNLRRLAS